MPHFRAAQVLEWVYRKGVIDPSGMSNISARERERLAEEMTFLSGEVVAHRRATDGVQKLLIQWADPRPQKAGTPSLVPLPVVNPADHAGSTNTATDRADPTRQTECVMIPSTNGQGRGDDRRTACISSQVGCPVGCRFCASGLGGLDGNLSAGRIVEQVWRLGQLKSESGEPLGRITNVVFMGMGEPLANFTNVVTAIRTINAPWGLGISARKITVSTVGLPQAIERLAEELDLPVTLALSLHAPTDDIRRRLIPWAEYTTIKDLLAACSRWFEKTGREITLEYTLLRGVNDRATHAQELARLARTLRANVNLIRYNEVEGLDFLRPRTDDVLAFQKVLRSHAVNVHIRASRGRDIAAACGQLRHESSRNVQATAYSAR